MCQTKIAQKKEKQARLLPNPNLILWLRLWQKIELNLNTTFASGSEAFLNNIFYSYCIQNIDIYSRGAQTFFYESQICDEKPKIFKTLNFSLKCLNILPNLQLFYCISKKRVNFFRFKVNASQVWPADRDLRRADKNL